MSATSALDAFAIIVDVPVAWGEMDALGHVNNVVYFRYFESARIAYLDAIGFLGPGDGTAARENAGAVKRIGPILAATHCRFRRPLVFPDTIRVGARATRLDDDRFTMEYIIVSEARHDTVAEGGGVVVAYDYDAGHKVHVPEPVRRRILEVDPGIR